MLKKTFTDTFVSFFGDVLEKDPKDIYLHVVHEKVMAFLAVSRALSSILKMSLY